MELWKIRIVGLAITIVTSILIHKRVKINKTFVDILVATNIAVVGGIAEGWWFSYLLTMEWVVGKIGATIGIISTTILIAIVIWIVGASILILNQFRTSLIIITKSKILMKR